MLSKKGKIIISIIVVAVMICTAFTVTEYKYYLSNNKSQTQSTNWLYTTFEVSPSASNSSQRLIQATIQIWGTPPPSNSTNNSFYVTQQSNVSPFLQVSTNSSGNTSGYFSTAFKQYLIEWINYLTKEKQFNEEIGLDLEITYVVTHNATYNEVVMAGNEIEINPFNILKSLTLNITDHPSLSNLPHFYVPVNNAVSLVNSVTSLGTNLHYLYVWYLIKSTTFHNGRIPLAFGNDTGGNALMDLSITLGSGTTSFTGGRVYNINNTVSYYIDNNGTFNPNNVINSTGILLRPPSVNKIASAGYIYAVGNVTVDKYQEACVNLATGVKEWLNNFYAHIYVSSINIANGRYVLGSAYDAYDPNCPYDNPTAIKQLGFLNNMTNTLEGNVTPGNEITWGAIYSSTSGDYNNLQGTINGIIGLGLAVIGLVTAVMIADGWTPASGWANIGLVVLAISGVVSSVLGLVLTGVVNAKSSAVVFGGDAKNDGEVGNPFQGNPILFYAYVLKIDVNFNDHNYIFPVMWLTGKPA
ncbi:MAG: hypothetical protein QXW79_01800 [Thermoplasmata archaeon]